MEEYENEFEYIWKIYPVKKGKVNAKKSYIKAREKGTTYNEVILGLERYLKYCEKEKGWYRPKFGSTWFNQQSWLDEFDEGESLTVAKDNLGNYVL